MIRLAGMVDMLPADGMAANADMVSGRVSNISAMALVNWHG